MAKRRAVITGAAGTIGRGLVAAFQEAGYEVIATDQGEGGWVSLDLTDAEAIARFCAETEGPVHALVNNAGIASWDKPVEETTTAEFDRVIAVNLRAPFLMVKGFLPKFAPDAAVVNVASLRWKMTDDHNEPYSASKGGLYGLTQAMAVSLGRSHGLRLNTISPGWIVAEGESVRPEDDAIHPLGRVGRAPDIAGAALYLCDPGSAFVTGTDLIVDGGMQRVMAYPPE
ncbi:SDR family oxidoreductase [bacterium]|nr:MAG: SDR family oxidoreductase [bacterium]